MDFEVTGCLYENLNIYFRDFLSFFDRPTIVV